MIFSSPISCISNWLLYFCERKYTHFKNKTNLLRQDLTWWELLCLVGVHIQEIQRSTLKAASRKFFSFVSFLWYYVHTCTYKKKSTCNLSLWFSLILCKLGKNVRWNKILYNLICMIRINCLLYNLLKYFLHSVTTDLRYCIYFVWSIAFYCIQVI